MELSILWLRSVTTGKEFPVVQFSGDTDMETGSVASLTSIERNEVVVAWLNGNETTEEFERRVNTILSRNDLRATVLVRVENKGNLSLGSSSFQDFRKNYQSPTLYYNDVFSVGGEAIVSQKLTLSEFKSRGGRVTRINGDA